MQIKQIIKKLLPNSMFKFIKIILINKTTFAYYRYDARKFIKHSNTLNTCYNNNEKEKLLGLIIAEYHAIEKGLTMPEIRLGFGVGLMKNLISHCNLFENIFENYNPQYLQALSVIIEYKDFHLKNNFEIDENLMTAIDAIQFKNKNLLPSKQLNYSKHDYYQNVNSSFDLFSNSRHSLRNFQGEIEVDLIKDAIQLAQNAPSACNRQPSRIYIVEDKGTIEQALEVQNGNRGFGHLADKLLVLTVEIGAFLNLNERNDIYVNGGIYAMNLLYALHFHKIGACSLNWCSSPNEDLKLRKICEIEESESVIMLIACGGVPDKFNLAFSSRNDGSMIIKER